MDPISVPSSANDRQGRPPTFVAFTGLGVLFAGVVGLAMIRGPYGPSRAVADTTEAEAADRASGRADGPHRSKTAGPASAGSADAASPDGDSSADASSDAEAPSDADAALAQFRDRWKVRDSMGALAALERLAELDKDAFKDSDLQSDILSMTQLLSKMPGDAAQRTFTLLTKKTGTHGLDILLYLVTNKGGSLASEMAANLLKKPEILSRGSKPMQIAYNLRTLPCAKKKDLFDDAAKHGDRRALAQLQILSRTHCGRRSTCCYGKDKNLEAAEAAIEARTNQ